MTYSRDWAHDFSSKGAPSVREDPARLGAAIGTIAVIVGAILPWAVGNLPKAGPRHVSGFDGPGDSIFLMATAVAVLVLVGVNGFAAATGHVARILPIAVTAAMTLVWVQDYVAARREVDAWLSFRGTGDIGLGLWLVAAGIFLMGLGTVWMALRGPPQGA